VGYRLGIDLGATTAVAVVVDDAGTVRAVPLGREAVVPAAVLVDANGSVRCGEDAIAGAAGAPDRLVRRFVQRIGDEVPITAGPAGGVHLRLNAQDITAAMVAWVVARATAAQRSVPEAVALVHPAGWAAHKLELMQRALDARGLGAVRLVNAAAAAGHVWVRGVPVASGDAFAIFDLGGESIGATVLRVDPDGRAWPLGVPVSRPDLGGVDFDDAVLRHVLEVLDPAVREALSDDAANAGAPAPDALRQACRTAKETLSAATDATVEVNAGGRRVPTRITRAEFEARIAEVTRRGVDVLLDAVAAAGLRPGDLSGVMLCGGTSAVPLIAQQLTSRLGPAVRLVREPHPAFTAAAGAALLCAPIAPVAIEAPAPVPAAPERPQLDVPTVVGRKPATIPAARVEQPDPGARWGSIRITPMRKGDDSAAAPERGDAKAAAKAAAEREKAMARQAAAEQKAAAARREALEKAATAEREARELATAKERAQAELATRRAELDAEQAFALQAAAARKAAARQAAELQQAAREQAAAQRAAEQDRAAARLAVERDRVAAQLAAERERAAAQRAQAAARQAAERQAAERQAAERQAAARQAVQREQAMARQAAAHQAAEREQAIARQAADRQAAAREQARREAAANAPADTQPMPAVRPDLLRPTRTERRGGRAPIAPAPPVTARSVVGPRPLGSLADLLGTAAPARIPRAGSTDDAETETEFLPAQAADVEWAQAAPGPDPAAALEELEDGEYWEYADVEDYDEYDADEQEDYEDVPQQLWRRGLAVCQPRRVFAVAAIATALFVGANGWQEAIAPIVGGSNSTSAPDPQSVNAGDTGSVTTRSDQAAVRVDHTDSSRRASLLPG
jgi:hypothetical protein